MKSRTRSFSVGAAFAICACYVLFASLSVVSGHGPDPKTDPKAVSCPGDTLYGQPPALPGDPAFYGELYVAERAVFDNFSAIAADIVHIRWWGLDITPFSLPIPCGPEVPEVCTRDGNAFLIEFRLDDGGQPGDLYYQEEVSAANSVTTLIRGNQ